MKITFRPIETFPGKRTKYHSISQFRAGYQDTLNLLQFEVEALDGKNVVVQLDVGEASFRVDGSLRADARPRSPAIILSFDSKHGPLTFATDRFENWKENLRAIALGMKALRAVDRYGINQGGKQYTGWKAIGSGIEMPAAASQMTYEQASDFIVSHAGSDFTWTNDGESLKRAYRSAARILHPDNKRTGNEADFKKLSQAWEIVNL